MDIKTITGFLWHIVIVDGWSVLWRVGLLSVLFGVLGLLVFGLCYKVFFRGERLKLSLKHERFFEWLITGLWAVSIPCLSVALGALVGGWWAGSFLIKTEHLGERVGKVAFKAVAAGIASAELEQSEYEQAKYAKALMDGTEKLKIEKLHQFSSHHAGELSASSLESLLPVDKEGAVHNGTVWAVEKTLDTIAYYELSSEGDIVYKLASKMAAHDRETDNDGLVTVEEISDVACEAFLNRTVTNLWGALMLELILPLLATLALLPVVPPLFAWLVRKVVAWWRRRQGKDPEFETAPENDRNTDL